MQHASPNADGRLVDHDANDGERQYAMWMHLSLLGNLFAPIVIFAMPLVMWLVKKNESPFVDDHGRETLNFHVSLLIYSVLAGLLGTMTCGVLWILIPALYVLGIVGMVAASKAASQGEYYRYPMTIRFL